jgi:hypothetical protein
MRHILCDSYRDAVEGLDARPAIGFSSEMMLLGKSGSSMIGAGWTPQ